MPDVHTYIKLNTEANRMLAAATWPNVANPKDMVANGDFQPG